VKFWFEGGNMARRLAVVRSLTALHRAIDRYRSARDRVALVPTMGALHEGHLSLVRLARRRADRVVVSIFVNPAQFAPTEDFGTYPRTLQSDVAALAKIGTDLVWAPPVEVMYSQGFATRIVPEGPARAGLEDAFRPHFFSGVATVVAKLFLQCRPDLAIFGEKDFQQLKVVTRMARDLDIGVKVVGGKTVRERDGLAMSSRNVYLSPQERTVAPTLHRVLARCAAEVAAGQPIAAALDAGRQAIEDAGFVVDYLAARHAETLEPIEAASAGPIRLLVAARLGKTRLIDNIGV
jgi:pantoate--beta-alanine ligase